MFDKMKPRARHMTSFKAIIVFLHQNYTSLHHICNEEKRGKNERNERNTGTILKQKREGKMKEMREKKVRENRGKLYNYSVPRLKFNYRKPILTLLPFSMYHW